jgi:hypothetical protein
MLRPELVATIDFLEWTGADHLRHTKFVGLRQDKDPLAVVRETLRGHARAPTLRGAAGCGGAAGCARTCWLRYGLPAGLLQDV